MAQKPLTVPTTNDEAPQPAPNGSAAAPETGEGCPETDTPSTEERIARLEQQVARLAAGVASLLAEKMQPQIQQTILARLTGS